MKEPVWSSSNPMPDLPKHKNDDGSRQLRRCLVTVTIAPLNDDRSPADGLASAAVSFSIGKENLVTPSSVHNLIAVASSAAWGKWLDEHCAWEVKPS